MYRLYKSVSYHATSEELWQDIREEGVLWGALPSVVQQYGKQADINLYTVSPSTVAL